MGTETKLAKERERERERETELRNIEINTR